MVLDLMGLGSRQGILLIFNNYEGVRINEIPHHLEIEIKIIIDDTNTT